MVLRRLFYALINNAQVVEKLSESRPIRRAAQITAFAIAKAQIAGKDAYDASTKPLRSETFRQIREETSKMPRDVLDLGRRATRLRDTFVKEVKEGTRDANRPIKDRK
uniref:Si:ch211-162e15.3 n=1 Tax=Sinocyclocheilus grahami TaxID=75366 RepID=A0A672S140_SINGR